MADERRRFIVPRMEWTPELMEQMIPEIPYQHDGPHLELYYNLIFNELGFKLPDHLRPVTWVLADKNIDSAMLIISPGAGKSMLTNVAFPTYEIGYNPNISILGISSGADLMLDFLNTSMSIIEDNDIYHLIYPQIQPDEATGWSAARGIFVKRPTSGQVSPSYQVTGYGSKKVTGKHAKILIVDDIHDAENSSSADQIEKIETYYYNTIIGRQEPEGSRMIMVGRRWADDDLYGRLNKSGDWFTMTLASIREGTELYYDVRIPAGLACVFNDYKAKDTVEDIKLVYGENTDQPGFYWTHTHVNTCPPNCKGMSAKYREALVNKKNKPAIFETVYQSNPEAIGSKIFYDSDFQDFILPENMEFGRNYDTTAQFIGKMGFDMILQSWDTAFTAETRNDPSVCITLGIRNCQELHRGETVNPDEDTPFHYDVYVLDVIIKHLQPGDLEEEAITYFGLWNPSQVLIEKSAMGIPLINNLTSFSIPVIGVTVQHTSKKGRAINGANAGSAQGWAKRGRIFIPRNASWSKELLTELCDFTGARGKRDDQVDALVQAINFAIDYGTINRELPPGWRSPEEINERLKDWMFPDHPLVRLPHMYHNVQNPFFGMCGTCKFFDKPNSFCKQHKHKVTSLQTCPLYSPTEESILSIDYGQPRKHDT